MSAPRVLEVVRPGALATIQDLGRPGHGRFGVAPSGAMDRDAHRLASALVGNPANAPGLEITGPGAELRFAAHTFVALAGADLQAELDGAAIAVPAVIAAAAGARLRFTGRRRGARVSVAVAGGIVASGPFASAATDLSAGFGAPLRAGHLLSLGPERRRRPAAARLGTAALARLLAGVTAGADFTGQLRYVPEPEGGVSPETQLAFARRAFRLSARSNRTGFRFEGDPLDIAADPDRLSEPTAPGAIQLPPDGLPILLMADRNTTGGYPRLGHLASADAGRAAQLWPGDLVGFRPITMAAAVSLVRRQERALGAVLAALA